MTVKVSQQMHNLAAGNLTTSARGFFLAETSSSSSAGRFWESFWESCGEGAGSPLAFTLRFAAGVLQMECDDGVCLAVGGVVVDLTVGATGGFESAAVLGSDA